MKLKKIKVAKLISVVFLVLLSVANFAVAVSDNDGSAFITKAEFDSLKNSFQSQIDQYNTSIDSKIDYAISSYLAGVKVEKVISLDEFVTKLYNQSPFATTFVDKTQVISGSNNANFVRGGWWFTCVFGWNTAVSGTYTGMINFSGAAYKTQALTLSPSSTTSYKWFVKGVNISGNTYYGPYDDILHSMEEQVYVQKQLSVWRNTTKKLSANRITSNATFDLTSLTTAGNVNVGSYNNGWYTWDDIQGTVIMNYKNYQTGKTSWAAMNATSSVETSNIYYCIDTDKQQDLTVETEDCDLFKSYWGVQFQQWKVPERTGTEGGDQANVAAMTLKYNKPEVLQFRHNDLYNYMATEMINEPVPMYAGIPVCRIPRSGKIKFKYKVETYRISDNVATLEPVRVAFKIKQFANGAIASETEKLYEKTNAELDKVYECDFKIENAKSDGSSILYVKAAPTNDTTYVRVHIVEPPVITVE
jgi:hypothetical protein